MVYSADPIEGPITVKLARFVPGGPHPYKDVGTFDTLREAIAAGDKALGAVAEHPETAGYLLFDDRGYEVGNWTYWDATANSKS